MRRLLDASGDRVHLWLMLALTFTTGINDAVGYLGLDKVFTGNMTGNVVVLGMALAGGSGLPVLGPALALVGFMAGAALGGRALRTSPGGWCGRVTGCFGGVAAIMLGLGVVLLVVRDPSHADMVRVTTTAAVAMGLQAATARHLAVRDVTTVVVTSTITGLAADSVLGAGRDGHAARRLTAVALILLGALVGALLLKVTLGLGLVVAGAVVALVTVAGGLHARAA
jgi:uncharacterized membrane protein YoaK (UPF0700 family)